MNEKALFHICHFRCFIFTNLVLFFIQMYLIASIENKLKGMSEINTDAKFGCGDGQQSPARA